LAGTALAELWVLGFACPFALLLSRSLKRRPERLAAGAGPGGRRPAIRRWGGAPPSFEPGVRAHPPPPRPRPGAGRRRRGAAGRVRGEEPLLEVSARYVTT